MKIMINQSVFTDFSLEMGKNLPAMQEIRVQSLHWDDPQKGMATHSSMLAWRIPWTEEPGGLQSMESQLDTTEQLTLSHFRDGERGLQRLSSQPKVVKAVSPILRSVLFCECVLGRRGGMDETQTTFFKNPRYFSVQVHSMQKRRKSR